MDTSENGSVSIKQASKIIRKMRLSNNDVVLIKTGTPMAQNDNLIAFSEAVGATGLDGIIVVVVDEFDDIINIKEEKMREHGWFKFDSASAAIMARILKEQIDDQDDSVQPS